MFPFCPLDRQRAILPRCHIAQIAFPFYTIIIAHCTMFCQCRVLDLPGQFSGKMHNFRGWFSTCMQSAQIPALIFYTVKLHKNPAWFLTTNWDGGFLLVRPRWARVSVIGGLYSSGMTLFSALYSGLSTLFKPPYCKALSLFSRLILRLYEVVLWFFFRPSCCKDEPYEGCWRQYHQ